MNKRRIEAYREAARRFAQGQVERVTVEHHTSVHPVSDGAFVELTLFIPFREILGDLIQRASQDVICQTCQKTYGQHPMLTDAEYLSHDEQPYLHELCNGDIVKL